MPTTADEVFIFFTWFGVLALAVGVICAVAIAVSGNMRDASLKRDLAASAERIEVLKKQTETLRAANLKLELKLAPRTLSREKLLDLIAGLMNANLGGVDVDIVSYEASGTDVAPLTQQIAGALHSVHAKAHLIVPLGTNPAIRGILVRTSTAAPANIKEAAGPLVAVLKQIGLDAAAAPPYPDDEPAADTAVTSDGAGEAKLRILIGGKP